MMSDLAYASPLALPLCISFDDLLDADEAEHFMTCMPDPDAAITAVWPAQQADDEDDLDAAITTVMPAQPAEETPYLKDCFERCGLPFVPSVVLSLTMMAGILATIVATSF